MVALKDEKDFRKIRVVYLLLGPECNMRCRHCSQTPVKKDFRFDDEISADTKRFLDSFIKFAVEAKPVKGVVYRVLFWGGEALLHWKLIKSIVEEYASKYDYLKNDNFRFHITSNGLLLTDEMVDFFNKYDVIYCFSYDAPNPFAVRGYVPDTVCERVNRLKNFSIMSSFTAFNCDWYSAYHCLKRKFPNGRYSIGVQLVQSFDMPKELYSFDFDEIRRNFKKARISAQLGNKFLQLFLYRMLSAYRFAFLNEDFRKFNVRGCFPGYRNLAVMLDGKVGLCHNTSASVATVNDSLETIYERGLSAFLERQSLECKTCEHNDICNGSCVMSLHDADGSFSCCNLYKKRIFKEFKEEMLMLGKPLSDEDRKWFEEEDKKTEGIVQKFLRAGVDR